MASARLLNFMDQMLQDRELRSAIDPQNEKRVRRENTQRIPKHSEVPIVLDDANRRPLARLMTFLGISLLENPPTPKHSSRQSEHTDKTIANIEDLTEEELRKFTQ